MSTVLSALLVEEFDAASHGIEEAKVLLAHANDVSVPMSERITARDRANAIRLEASIGRAKVGVWPVLEGDNADGKPSTPAVTSAPVNGGKPASSAAAKKTTAVSTASNKPLVPGFDYVANALQKFIFDNVLIPEITKADGRWTNSKPHGHAEPFKIATAVIDPNHLGITFEAAKRNYNLNDSTWLKPEVINPMLKAASAHLNREVGKKEMTTELEALKKILSKDAIVHDVGGAPAISAPATGEIVETPVVETPVVAESEQPEQPVVDSKISDIESTVDDELEEIFSGLDDEKISEESNEESENEVA